MTPTERDNLAKRIINAVRTTAPYTEWQDALTNLDAGRAGTAFIRLRDTHEDNLTIARFKAVYRTLHTTNSDTRCETCNGDAWINAEPQERWGQVYRYAKPCPTCNRGAA